MEVYILNRTVLTKSLSAINQQIALKTIKKLGFAVVAVWNGKEALDYLLAADSPNPPHSKPDLILMDVQMPVIDGYRATHIIRHHEPYKWSLREIPIVAMTASAIQGDREKCKKAGMDDYLAKPVRGKTLEKMIVKWAVSRRIPLTPGSVGEYEDGSDCSEPGDDNCRAGTGQRTSHEHAWEDHQHRTMEMKAPRPTMSERENSHRLTLPGSESEGDRAEHRGRLEEKALALRDEKLVDAAGPGDGLSPPMSSERQDRGGQRLTVENMGRLEREENPGKDTKVKKIKRESTVDSLEAAESSDDQRSNGERPRVPRRWKDSQRTVTGRSD